MKTYTDKELKRIFNDISGGAVYVGLKDGKSIGDITSNYNFIYFRHYGQTASKKIFSHFKNTLYIMFSDCDEIAPAVWSWDKIKYIAADTGVLVEG